MKVFAHFKDATESVDGLQYRWRTLLQFGNSWEILGTVIMKNPGSSRPIYSTIPEATLQQLQQIDNEADWYEFTVDTTMSGIGRLFSIYCHNRNLPLNGVVQIFNLFNIREADLNKALAYKQQSNDSIVCTWQKDREQLKGAIYLGWGDLGKEELFKQQALTIFEQTKQSSLHYLSDNFHHNKFYHPLYLTLYGKKKENVAQALSDFCQQKYLSDKSIIDIPEMSLDAKEIASTVQQKLMEYGFQNFGNNQQRFTLSTELQVTVTHSEKGYVGIRHQEYAKKYGEYPYPHANEYRMDLEDFGYQHKMNDVWLGTKTFKEYGYSNADIAEAIIKEITYLHQYFGENYKKQC